MATDIKTKMTFEDYLAYDDGSGNRYEWIDGVLVATATESEFNEWLSSALQLYFMNSGWVRPRLVKRFNCEIEVPTLQPKQARNRFPDLVVLRPEHIGLTQKRLTIRLDMPPPALVVEAVRPWQGKPRFSFREAVPTRLRRKTRSVRSPRNSRILVARSEQGDGYRVDVERRRVSRSCFCRQRTNSLFHISQLFSNG